MNRNRYFTHTVAVKFVFEMLIWAENLGDEERRYSWVMAHITNFTCDCFIIVKLYYLSWALVGLLMFCKLTPGVAIVFKRFYIRTLNT